MKKFVLGIILALFLALTIPIGGWADGVNNITTAGVDGNWVIYDQSKNIIATWDATNRKLTIPSGSLLETLGTTITLGNISYTVPTNNGDASQYLQTDGAGVLSWAAPTSTVAWDDIGDPDADATIAFAGYKETISSTLNAAGGILTMTNTTADLTADVSFIDLKFTDDGDANGFFIRGYDNAGGDLKFSVGADGKLTITGDVTSTVSVLANNETTVDTVLKGNITLNYNSNSISNTIALIQFFTKDIVSWKES